MITISEYDREPMAVWSWTRLNWQFWIRSNAWSREYVQTDSSPTATLRVYSCVDLNSVSALCIVSGQAVSYWLTNGVKCRGVGDVECRVQQKCVRILYVKYLVDVGHVGMYTSKLTRHTSIELITGTQPLHSVYQWNAVDIDRRTPFRASERWVSKLFMNGNNWHHKIPKHAN